MDEVLPKVVVNSKKPAEVSGQKKRKAEGVRQPLVKHHEGQKWFEYQVGSRVRRLRSVASTYLRAGRFLHDEKKTQIIFSFI